jgi:hypothetical protein
MNKRDLLKEFNVKFPETELDVYNEIEVNYTASLLKRKTQNRDILPIHEIRKIFNKALRTLKSKMQELLLHKSFNTIKGDYEVPAHANDDEGRRLLQQNTIKLLLRCKKMEEARIGVLKILRTVIKREEMRDRLL